MRPVSPLCRERWLVTKGLRNGISEKPESARGPHGGKCYKSDDGQVDDCFTLSSPITHHITQHFLFITFSASLVSAGPNLSFNGLRPFFLYYLPSVFDRSTGIMKFNYCALVLSQAILALSKPLPQVDEFDLILEARSVSDLKAAGGAAQGATPPAAPPAAPAEGGGEGAEQEVEQAGQFDVPIVLTGGAAKIDTLYPPGVSCLAAWLTRPQEWCN